MQEDQQLASDILDTIVKYTGGALRIGITGAPGTGKSTFIETFGNHITKLGKKLAVLSIDPSSQISKGSILGDKTRMEGLSKNPRAFIRPSASGTTLGGVANRTREAMLLCEAAGYDVIIIETVGVGQSEVAVKDMVDFFLLLNIAGAGDELQGIKKGIMEMADAIVITKADGENLNAAKRAQGEYEHALQLFSPSPSNWFPVVRLVSSIEGRGIHEIWSMICDYESKTKLSGFFTTNRNKQNLKWMYEYFNQILKSKLTQSDFFRKQVSQYESDVLQQNISPLRAAQELAELYFKK